MEKNHSKSFIPTQKQKQALKVLQRSDSNTVQDRYRLVQSEVPLAALMGERTQEALRKAERSPKGS